MILPPSAPLKDRIIAVVKSLQFVWFTGHLLTLLGTLHYVLTVVLFRPSAVPYRIAYLGAIISYSVVLYKAHGSPQVNAKYADKLLVDGNSEYLILAMCWLILSPITVTLIPYFTFSAFHAIDYVRTNIIPNIFPPPVKVTNGGSDVPVSWQARTQRRIKSTYDQYYGPAMRLVAQAEVTVIVIRLFLGVLRLQLLPFVLYTLFLRFRYHLSVYTRQAFTEVRTKLDDWLLSPELDPRIPPVVPKIYVKIKYFISRYGVAQDQPEPVPTQQKSTIVN